MKEKDLLLKAIKKNELIEYLEGKDSYKVEAPHFVPAFVPTDWTQIIPRGIYKVFQENQALKLNEMFEDAIFAMLDREPFDIYVALSVIFSQLYEEQRGAAPFNIDRERILPKLRNSLLKNEEKLKKYFEWEGKNSNEGIWSVVLRLNSLCKSKWNISIL